LSVLSLLYYPEAVEALNPAEAGWRHYHDPDQGIVLFRNRFQDANDILGVYSATATRVKGHSGPDTNTFRLLGLGVPWVIGAGRTGQTAGQSNLFPAPDETKENGSQPEGTFLDYVVHADGSGYARGAGSCTGVIGHQRLFMASYAEEIGAAAAFLVADQSVNGRRWRINTPEFVEVEMQADGFLLKAPNGATLKATVVGLEKPLPIETGKLRYGGTTEDHNPGIHYEGKAYTHSRYIDVYCEGDITVVMTLQPKGRKHPAVQADGAGQVLVGSHLMQMP
jgi:hypothetical protein